MMNNVLLVGRIAKDIEITEKDDKTVGYLTIAILKMKMANMKLILLIVYYITLLLLIQ